MAEYTCGYTGAQIDAHLGTVAGSNLSSTNKITRSATLVVAASDSSAVAKEQADYVCDGVADNVELQAAVTAISSTGGTIHLASGTYQITVGILVTDNVCIRGEGYSTVLNVPSANEITCIENSDETTGNENIHISDLKIVGNRSGKTQDKWGIRLSNCDNSNVERVLVTDYRRGGIVLSCKTGSESTTYCQNCNIVACVSTNNEDHGLVIEGGNRCTITDSHTSGNLEYGLVLSNSDTCTVENCTSHGDGSGIEIAYNAINSVVTGNIVSSPQAWAGIVLLDSARSIISNNYVTGDSDFTGIYDHESTNSNTVITNNIVNDFDVGIYCIGQYDILTNNLVINCESTGLFVKDSNYCVISSNLLQNNGQTGSSNKYGLRLYNCAYCLVSSNQAIDTQGVATQTHGIFEEASDNNLIEGNVCRGNSSIQIRPIGSNTITRNNRGYVSENSGTATITSGNTAIVVTHGLYTTPTRVHVTPTCNPTNAVSFWWVDTLTSTQFTIHTNADPGTSGLSFDWRAVVGEGN